MVTLGRNFKPGIPLSKDFRNEVIQMAATCPISEICERYRINRSTVAKYTKQYRETGNIEPLSRKHIRTRSKLSFGDSMLLETIAQSKGSTSLKQIKTELSNFGDCGELSLSTLSRHVRKNLPSGKDYSRKRSGKCAGERFTYENLVYTQLALDCLSFGHFLKTCSNTLQTSNVWLPNMSCLYPIRTCFSVTCPRLDENDGNSLNLTAISGLHFTLHSVNQRAVRLHDMWENRFKVKQSDLLNEQVND